MVLGVTVNFSGLMSYSPQRRVPLTSPSFGSVGASTQYVSKSAGEMARLSVVVKLPNQRRAYVTVAETPGRSSCCSEAVVSQLYWRMPHPLTRSGSMEATVRVDPSGAESGPSSLSWGMKSRLASPQDRVALVT